MVTQHLVPTTILLQTTPQIDRRMACDKTLGLLLLEQLWKFSRHNCLWVKMHGVQPNLVHGHLLNIGKINIPPYHDGVMFTSRCRWWLSESSEILQRTFRCTSTSTSTVFFTVWHWQSNLRLKISITRNLSSKPLTNSVCQADLWFTGQVVLRSGSEWHFPLLLFVLD